MLNIEHEDVELKTCAREVFSLYSCHSQSRDMQRSELNVIGALVGLCDFHVGLKKYTRLLLAIVLREYA